MFGIMAHASFYLFNHFGNPILQKKYRNIDSELKFQITYGAENMSRLSIQSLKD